MSVTGASLARHRSVQDVATPEDFLWAVANRFKGITFDLAATPENSVCNERHFSPEDNSLQIDWADLTGNLWLNPPYGNIGPWAAKCAASADARHNFDRILFLAPASIGSHWFARHVHGRAMVLALTGRLKFRGHADPFPKDLILAVYGEWRGFDVWDWRPRRAVGASK